MDGFPLRIDNKQAFTVMVPKSAKLENPIDRVQFGIKSAACTIVQTSSNRVRVSRDLCNDLCIPELDQVLLHVNDGTLYLGPVIGIFTDGCKPHSPLIFGGRTADFEKWLKNTAKFGGTVYLFDAESIQWSDGKVYAFVYLNGKWKRQLMPLPNIIYDRIPNRALEQKETNQKTKERIISTYGTPWFNTGFFNKWNLYLQLKNNPIAGQYLPDTGDKIQEKLLKQKLNHYRCLFLKPKNSSHGRGIIKLTKTNDGLYAIKQSNRERQSSHFSSISEMLNTYCPPAKRRHYCWQQGLNLIKHQERSMDFRVHINKDGNGQWQVGAVAVKVCGEDGATSHVNFGGDVKHLLDVFSKSQARSYLSLLQDASLAVSEVVDQEYEGLIGELGLDFGIDQENRIWLFEANAKPGHTIFNHQSLRKQSFNVQKLWMSYCHYLFKQNIHKPGIFLARYNN